MDPAAILGTLLAFGAIFGALLIEGTDPMSILLPAPLLLVWVGTLGVGLAGHALRDALGAFRALPRALRGRVPEPEGTVGTLVALADRARREGMLALESDAEELEDPFVRHGLLAAIDGTDPEDLRAILEDRVATRRAQDAVHSGYFHAMGGYAPTIGIIGTVISLVHVLANLSEPDTLGHSIAAAFVATLWGILSANVVWLPLASRMRRVSELECEHMELATEGLLALQAGANPRLLEERLRSLLPVGTRRADVAEEADEDRAEAA